MIIMIIKKIIIAYSLMGRNPGANCWERRLFFCISFFCMCLVCRCNLCVSLMWSKSKVLRSGNSWLLIITCLSVPAGFIQNSSPPFRGQGLEKGRLPMTTAVRAPQRFDILSQPRSWPCHI